MCRSPPPPLHNNCVPSSVIEVSALDATNVDLCFVRLINDIASRASVKNALGGGGSGSGSKTNKGTLGNVPANTTIALRHIEDDDDREAPAQSKCCK